MSAVSQITTLIFDLFGVVISFDDDIVTKRLARHCATPELAYPALRDIVSRPALITGRISLRQLHEQLVAEHGLALDLSAFEAAWLEPYSQPMPGMAELIADLCQRHRLVLLSNVDKHYWAVVLQVHPELAHFQTLLTSWELGVAKPASQGFKLAMGRDNPASCFFIDDKADNIKAAQALGIRGHLFRDAQGLVRTLEDVGVR
ncbi:MAG: HAD-IA family hydrolase [Burkholderiales bacterium]|nr:HAD-IA family hydrolase [Burkholderiales bacterium]